MPTDLSPQQFLQTPELRLTITFQPQTSAVRVEFPNVPPQVCFDLLTTALRALFARVADEKPKSKIIIPTLVPPKL